MTDIVAPIQGPERTKKLSDDNDDDASDDDIIINGFLSAKCEW